MDIAHYSDGSLGKRNCEWRKKFSSYNKFTFLKNQELCSYFHSNYEFIIVMRKFIYEPNTWT